MQFEAGELEAAIETVNRWLVLSPLHEDAYRRLMRLHFAAGNRAAALHAYDTCRARLSTGMQTEPTPETVALVSRMRAVAPPRRKEASAHPVALSPATFLEGPLLGRITELSTLIKVYHTAQRGQTQVVLLEGEVGIGKTRLASEFLAWAEVEGADVLQGQAFETGGQLPYRPVIEALRPRIERENAPDDLLSDLWLAELARLLPELCDRYPDLPAPVGDKSVARNRLFEAVVRLGQALAARTPLVLFIDDVQWADAASLTNEDGGWAIDFTAVMEHEMVVRGFFPPSVREVICARLDRLPPNAFALLAAGAVLDQGITFELLCQVADLEEHDGLSALDEVLHSHLLQESEREGGPMTDGCYVFAHAKIRTVVYAEAGEARRSIFHRRALEALQAAAAPAAELAYHGRAAGLAEPAVHRI